MTGSSDRERQFELEQFEGCRHELQVRAFLHLLKKFFDDFIVIKIMCMKSTRWLIGIYNDAANKSWSKYTTLTK